VIVLQILVRTATGGASAGAPSSIRTGLSMKSFSSFKQQLDHLENTKNLTIDDRAAADDALRRIGYFSLIGGYKSAFKNPNTGNFKDGTEFNDILPLYEFDESLRELLLKYLLKVERNARTLLAYYFAEKYGISQAEYLNRKNFNYSKKHAATLAWLTC
jgi:abortive infection bacteriophage resistance protein